MKSPSFITIFLAFLASSFGYIAIAESPTLLTSALVISSFLMLAYAWVSAQHVLGLKSAGVLSALAIGLGYFAELMGTKFGWFFGAYTFTEVLGPQISGVPIVISMMWFVLAYIGYTMSCFLLYSRQHVAYGGLKKAGLISFVAAMLVTAFDLGADPYFVYGINAWIMKITDGAWFGETTQGFFGWLIITFIIVMTFQLLARNLPMPKPVKSTKWFALMPLVNYGNFIIFQMVFGTPVETKTIAFFAMGLPLSLAYVSWYRWSKSDLTS